DDSERRAGKGGTEMIGVEDPDVRPADPGGGGLGIVRHVLAAVGGGDEGALFLRPGEDDVARLVADEQGAHHASAVPYAVQLDNADAVGEMVDDPDLAVAARRDGHRLEADRDGGAMLQPMPHDAKDLEAAVRRVGREEEFPA